MAPKTPSNESAAPQGRRPTVAREAGSARAPAIVMGDDRGVPENLVYWGVIVGLLLACGGGVLILLGRTAPQLATLMTCVGFGIVLASFGARAAGTYKGWSATGAGALTVMLFLLLWYTTPAPPIMKRGQIQADLSKIADIRIVDEFPLYTFRDRTTNSVHFIIIDKRFKNDNVLVQVDKNGNSSGPDTFEMRGDGKTITQKYLGNEGPEVIKWTLSYENHAIFDGKDAIFFEPEQLDEDQINQRRSGKRNSFLWPRVIGKAHAFENQREADNAELLINNLINVDAAARRRAREALASLGADAPKSLMAALRHSAENYQIKLGVIFALAHMLRDDMRRSDAISAQLTGDDIDVLVRLTSDGDKTIRTYTTEFLYDLKDPRVTMPVLNSFRNDQDLPSGENKILILKGALPESAFIAILTRLSQEPVNISASRSAFEALANLAVDGDLSEVRERAEKVVKTKPDHRYNVIAASLPTEDSARWRTQELNEIFKKKGSDLSAETRPSTRSNYWHVTLGVNLPFEQACDIRSKAIAAGMNKGIHFHLWHT
jgi:hypothetical protein